MFEASFVYIANSSPATQVRNETLSQETEHKQKAKKERKVKLESKGNMETASMDHWPPHITCAYTRAHTQGLLPSIVALLSPYLCFYFSFKMFYLLNFPLYPNKMFHGASPNGFHPICSRYICKRMVYVKWEKSGCKGFHPSPQARHNSLL